MLNFRFLGGLMGLRWGTWAILVVALGMGERGLKVDCFCCWIERRFLAFLILLRLSVLLVR